MAKRHAYEAQFKLKAISYAEEHGNRAAAREFQINESMVRKWRKQENELRQAKKTKLSFRGQKARWPELEERLQQWIIEQRNSGRSVSTVTIQRKAVTLAEEMKIEHFQGSPSWCLRFMKRCHFSTRTRTTGAQQLPENPRPIISSETKSSVLKIPAGKSSASSSVGQMSDHESVEEMEVTIDEDECDNMKNIKSETADLRVAGPGDSGDEGVYVPIIPQRSTASELLLECKEEELEPWQKQTSLLKVKVEDDVGDLAIDQRECKPEPSPLQEEAGNTSPPKLKTETPRPAVFNNQGFIVASPQLTSSTNFIGSLGTQYLAGTLFTVVPAVQQQLFQKVAAAAGTPEPCGVVHTFEVHQISNNPVSLSSVPSPAVFATSSGQQQTDQSKSQTLSGPFPLPCFTVLELQSTGTSKNNE